MHRLLDLFCCQGGASRGYADAGFEVVGVDIEPQPRYPFPFAQMDAVDAVNRLLDGYPLVFDGSTFMWLRDFSAIHASPPCQAHSKTWKINKREHPRLIAPTRVLLYATGLPFVIENVEEARDELVDPVTMCGESFGLETYRHRLFETNWPLIAPGHPQHLARLTKMGRPYVPGEYMHVVGNFSGVDHARRIMGMPWATRDGLREAIPPAYTEFIGHQLISALSVGVSTEGTTP